MPAKLAVQPRAYVNPNMEKKKRKKKGFLEDICSLGYGNKIPRKQR
jgi:hypothetical protein